MNHPTELYVVFSATPYRMGRLIRAVTREPYNHVSIATEGELRTLYSFARRYYHTPLYGGFVTESPSRYHHQGRTADIRLYRLPLNEGQRRLLEAILEEAKGRSDRYLYNHLSALAAPIHRKIRVRDAFTCAEFVVSVLCRLGFPFDEGRFYSIGDIARELEAYHVYTGTFPLPAGRDPVFFQNAPLAHPWFATAKGFLKLLWRAAT